MKLQDMQPAVFAIVLVTILLAIGLVVMANLSQSIRSDATTTDDQFIAENTSCTAVGEFITTSTAVYTYVVNESILPSSYFNWDETGTYNGNCVILDNTGLFLNGSTINVSYTYGGGSAGQITSDASIVALGGFSSWFAIIIVIIAAAIIVGLVIRSFRG